MVVLFSRLSFLYPTSSLMRYKSVIFAVALTVVTTTFCSAQQRRPPVVSPQVEESGSVTFRLSAPEAKSVQVAGQWPSGTVELTKDENGVWSATVENLPKGVWEYSFRVDGVSMIDPANASLKPMRSPRTSILHLPSEPKALHDFQDVPHGTVHTHDYASKAAQDVRQYAVYTPAGYETSNDRYPVLVLQHGSGDNQATWVAHGKANWILDNLIAAGKAKPMIVVMLNGHVAPPDQRNKNVELFGDDLLNQVLPAVDKLYRSESTADKRAIVGLSMGGGQSLNVGLNNTDKFAYVGGFSSAVPECKRDCFSCRERRANQQKFATTLDCLRKRRFSDSTQSRVCRHAQRQKH